VEFKVPNSFNSVSTGKKTQTHFPMDPTKPSGEACNADSGLKEAHEIEWLHDPDDATPIANHKSAGLINNASVNLFSP
jgi:hypothetical protein